LQERHLSAWNEDGSNDQRMERASADIGSVERDDHSIKARQHWGIGSRVCSVEVADEADGNMSSEGVIHLCLEIVVSSVDPVVVAVIGRHREAKGKERQPSSDTRSRGNAVGSIGSVDDR